MRLLSIILLTTLFIGSVSSQDKIMLPADTLVTTKHETTIKGQLISYTAQSGTQPVYDDKGKVVASLFHTYYTRDGVQDRSARPLVISFNGGPGSASVWMHIAYTGPRILNIDAEGFPIQPYGFSENPHSILDVADIVFVNPVNTAYSRILDEETKREYFFGINADIKYLADWITTFVTRHERWTSPKYLIGESYGTTRCSGLALELQNRQWMYLNGVILVSPTDLGIERGRSTKTALYLPYYSATAWYHNALESALQSRDLNDLLSEVEAYTMNTLVPAIHKGSTLSDAEKESIAEQMSLYAGVSKESILQHNLLVPTSFFWKELLRDEGMTVGRLDSRYKGIDRQEAGSRYDYDPALTSWNHAFTPAINHYVKTELNFHTDLKYNIFGPVRPWDRSNDRTAENLRQAMAQNPYLHVMVQSGYFDGGTDYFNAKYNTWHMDPSGKLANRISFKGYRSGHMMYLRKADLENANEDIRQFILTSLPKGAARY